METDRGKVRVCLRDIDGITVGGTNYKAVNGAYIDLQVTSYPVMNYISNINTDIIPAPVMQSTDTFTDRLGATQYTGYARPSITINSVVKLDSINTNYWNTSNTTSDVVSINYNLIFSMWMLNHKYYLTDTYPISDSTTSYTPISVLLNMTDPFGNSVFDNTKGIPVIIKSITQTQTYISSESYIVFKIILEVDE